MVSKRTDILTNFIDRSVASQYLFGTLTRLFDLVYYDGPLATVFKSSKARQGELVLYYWCNEIEGKYNRWFAGFITYDNLLRHTTGVSDTKHLLSTVYDGTLIDIDGDGTVCEIESCAQIPKDCSPADGAHFNPSTANWK